MAGIVLGVGTGVFLIILIWIVALVFGIILSRASGATKLSIIPVFFLALVITLILVFFPRSPETPSPIGEVEIVDGFFVGRYVLLSVASLVFLVAFFMLLPMHFLEPVYAKPLRKH
ncbi:transmembrane protein 218 [Conger conger]|uniref:transmembrane protein 218 n=1 Tax=Conger conger TaxID=82655 RepID=UPI002A59D92F|nr:transmembrane protein 218 [Conger conger]XP_061105988.1 transmembrane protein 218 [Conger conger]XP_061105989.1 transmembrane protein 218 [Conger conger]XP_061105990.1 transmembrane protein 218 [Conger conger]